MEIKIINAAEKADIRLKNEPFPIYGRMIPTYVNEHWGHEIRLLPEDTVTEMCFPDEDYDFDAMKHNTVFVGAYDEDKCVGLAVLQDYMFRYMYLYDLKVSRNFRRMGIGQALLGKSKEIAASRGYRGIYTVGQDNNLAACQFYLKTGFHIGGFDNHVYKGTKQEVKADILFYLDC